MDFMASQQNPQAGDWDGYTERRTAPAPQVALKPGDPVTKEYLDEALRINRHSTRDFVGGEFAKLEALIRDGFPHGDPASHRAVHEGYIAQAHARAKFWRNVWEKVATGAIYAALVAIGTAVWQYIKAEAHR